MTDFTFDTGAVEYHESHEYTNYDGQLDRLSYDLDGNGHFDLVKEDNNFDGDYENSFRY